MRPDIHPQELWPGLDLDQQVTHAFEWARNRLMPAKRFDGEPVFFHTLRVASILTEEFSVRDSEAITVALLHDIIEDGNTTRAELRTAFGEAIANGVSILSKDSYPNRPRRSMRNAVASASDEVKLAKLADVLDNCRRKAKTRRARAAFSNAWKMIGLLRLAPQSDEVAHATQLASLRLAKIDPVHRPLKD